MRLAAAAGAVALYGAAYLACQTSTSDAGILIGEAVAFCVATFALAVTLAPKRAWKISAVMAGLAGAFVVGMSIDNLVSSCILTPWDFVVGSAVTISQVLSSPELAVSGVCACTQFASNFEKLSRAPDGRLFEAPALIAIGFLVVVAASTLPMEHRFYARLSTCIVDGPPARHPKHQP